MKTSNIFLPFWGMFGAVFAWYILLELLEKLGLTKGKTK